MEKITYGAPRLVDWVAQIKAGAATVRVHFTGGALTSYGVTPAEYTTANPFIQKVIEQSTYFKEGRIILLRRTNLTMGKILRKMNVLLDGRQKRAMAALIVMMLIGGVLESVGVSMLVPIVTVPSAERKDRYS